MLPKNNRNIFSDNPNVQPSTSNGNQQFRPSVSVSGNPFSYNSNLVVTQQQQPNRNNNTFQLNAPSNNNNNSTTISQFVAAMQQPQNPSLHLINRTSQSPIQINQNQNSQILMDRSQMIRLPQNTQADPTGINNLYQALYIIQQKFLQTDKTKPSTNHVPEICRPVVSTIHNPSVLNNVSNSLTAITINSTSNNQNPTVLAMSNADIQILEAISRLSSQQGSKQACHANVSLIQSDSAIAQQLLTAIQKQSPRTSTAVSSPSFMVIGQTSKPNQTHSQQTKDTINISPALSNINGTELSNSLLLKMPINSKAEIPVWTKLLDKLSSNSDNSTEVNRSCKIRELEDNQRKILSQPRLQSNNSKGHHNEYIQRSSDFQSSTSGLKSSSSTSKSLNNNDTHQILRDNKALSYLVSSPNNVSINNDYMVDEHFQKSLWDKMDVKKTHNQGNSFNYQSFDSNNGNTDIINMKNPIANKANVRNKTFIDLERPDSRNKNIGDCMSRGSTPTQTGSCVSNSQLTIKQKADAMVENLLKRTLNYPANKTHCGTNITHTNVTNEISCITTSSNKGCQSSINTHTNNVVINPRDNLINSTSMLQDTGCKVLPFQSSRPNPSKSDLPLKKRIMLDFNENGDENMSEKHLSVIKPERKIEMNTSSEEKHIKIRRKRIHTDSLNSDSKTDSSSHDPSLPIAKKRRGRIPGTGKNQKLKEQCRLKEMAKISLAGIEENWQELVKTLIRPPDIDSISSKTLSPLDLEPLKLSKEEFFQIGSCSEIAPRMVKCRSCRQNNNNNTSNNAQNPEPSTSAMDEVSSIKSGSKDSSTTTVVSSFCRFHGFRKLQFSAKGTLTHAGFCKSNEADAQDLSLWRMYQPLPSELSVSIATYLVKSLSSIFCEIIDAENQFLQDTYQFTEESDNRTSIARRIQANSFASGHKSDSIGFVWKRPVQGVREMCDVCETSIFNTHWACRKCGYSICVDCFNERNDVPVAGSTRVVLQQEFKEKENNSIQIKSTNLNKTAVHLNTRGANRNRYFSCSHPWAVCTANRQQHNPDQMLKVELIPIRVINELRNRMHTVAKLLQINLRCNCLTKSKTDAGIKLSKQLSLDSIPAIEKDHLSSGNFDLHMLADIALKEVVSTDNKTDVPGDCNEQTCLTGVPRPPPVLSPPHHPENGNYTNNNNTESKFTDGNTTVYSWINVSSNFKMIHLHNAQSSENLRLFQQEWLQAHPVLISGCHETMDLSLWTPEKFLEEFESEPALLVDCETGFPVPRATMKSFWEGFDCFEKRISSSEGSSKPACLKLKDWPPSEDFNDVLPQRCKDILSNLPIKEYTTRQGEFNLAAHLPDFFVCPDLGPKLYNAYGMPRESKLGTTNLHLDIADAVNVMLYVSVPSDNSEKEIQNAFESMREAKVDNSVIKRSETELPGALWHIFLPKHVPKLRQFLINVINERGESMGANQDPIHDQLFYLNQPLLDQLKEETSIEGCAIVQFRGDAVFIPAGAPHQVRNLHSCMKVANDFVSPENILNCLRVTKEFRQLSSTHANHEDKLQAKNMIFHAVKDAVSTLIVRNSHVIVDSNGRQREHTIKRKRSNNQTDDNNTTPWSPSLTKEEPKTVVDH